MKSYWFGPRVYLNTLLHRWGPYHFLFLHLIKALFYKDTCCPLGGLDPVSSPFMCVFWGEGWAQVRRINYSSAGQSGSPLCRDWHCCLCCSPTYRIRDTAVQGVFVWLQISLLPAWCWLYPWRTCCHLPESFCLKIDSLKTLHPRLIPLGHFYLACPHFCPTSRKGRRLQAKLPSYLS